MVREKKERRLRKEALEYHELEPRGKIKVVPTKPHSTAYELSLAYSPGVAQKMPTNIPPKETLSQ